MFVLAAASDRPPGRGKVAESVQWPMFTLGEDQLPFKTTAAMFGCIPARESSPGLDSTDVTKLEGSAMESDVLLAEDLQQRWTAQIQRIHTCQQQRWTWKLMPRLKKEDVGQGRL